MGPGLGEGDLLWEEQDGQAGQGSVEEEGRGALLRRQSWRRGSGLK